MLKTRRKLINGVPTIAPQQPQPSLLAYAGFYNSCTLSATSLQRLIHGHELYAEEPSPSMHHHSNPEIAQPL